jgi:hypothetical protein
MSDEAPAQTAENTEAAQEAVDQAQSEAEEAGTQLDWDAKTIVKLDGEEREVTLAELRDNYQLRTVSHKKMEEAASVRKRVNQVLEHMRTEDGFLDVAQELGIDARELAKRILAEESKLEAMEPADRRAYELEQRERAIEEKERRFQQAQQQQRINEETRRAQQKWANDFRTAGETVGLEVTPEVMGELAGIIEQAIDAGYTDLTAVDAAKIYQEREKERRAAYLKGVSPDDLTPEQHAKLREKRMETAKGLRTKKPASPAPVVERKRVHMHEVPSLKDFFDGKV